MKSVTCRPILERLLLQAALLASKDGIKTKELAQRLEVSSKTIHRDIDFLRDRLLVDLECTRPGYRYVAVNPRQLPPIVETLASFLL